MNAQRDFAAIGDENLFKGRRWEVGAQQVILLGKKPPARRRLLREKAMTST